MLFRSKWLEVGSIKGPRAAFFKQHGIEMIPAKEINGIEVIPLGEQYLRQGFGAIAPSADIATFQKRAEHMIRASKQLRNLIKEAGFTEKMPGALLIRDKKILNQLHGSNKLYRDAAEIERVIKAGVDLPSPSQIIETIDAAGDTLYLAVIRKPFTATELARLKFLGAVDTVRDIFRPALTINKKAVQLMDDVNSLAVEARALEGRIAIAQKAGRAGEAARLQTELAVINSRARAIGRQIDFVQAGRVALRPIAIARGDYLVRVSFNELARTNPRELAQKLSAMRVTERNRVMKELEPQYRTALKREMERLPAQQPSVARRGIETVPLSRMPVSRVPARAEIARVPEIVSPRAVVPRAIGEMPPRIVPSRLEEVPPSREVVPRVAGRIVPPMLRRITPPDFTRIVPPELKKVPIIPTLRVPPPRVPPPRVLPRRVPPPEILIPEVPPPRDVAEEKQRRRFPPGTIGYPQGALKKGGKVQVRWDVFPPPWDMDKPITIIGTPKGFKEVPVGTTPQAGIQVLPGRVPKSIDVDMGWVDIHIDATGEKPTIHFKAGGEKTDVGKRVLSPTKGITVRDLPAETELSGAIEERLTPRKQAKRAFHSPKLRRPKKPAGLLSRYYLGQELPDWGLGGKL